MVELTEREKKLVLIKYIIHGVSPYKDAPISTRAQMLKVAFKTLGIKHDEAELLDLGDACLKLQGDLNESLIGFLHTNKDLVDMALNQMKDGNDRLKL